MSHGISVRATLSLDDCDLDCEGVLYEGSPGHWTPTYSCGGCPPDGPEVEDVCVYLDGVDVTEALTEHEYERVVNALIESTE